MNQQGEMPYVTYVSKLDWALSEGPAGTGKHPASCPDWRGMRRHPLPFQGVVVCRLDRNKRATCPRFGAPFLGAAPNDRRRRMEAALGV